MKAGIICFMFIVACPGVLRAEEEELPKAKEVLDQYIAATGGQEAYDKIKNRVTKSTIDLKGQGMKIALELYAAKPNLMATVTEIPGMGKMDSGTNGEVVWENNLMTGPVVKEGEERDLGLALAVFDRIVYWKRAYEKAKCAGMEDVDGKPCYKLELTPKRYGEKKEEGERKDEEKKPHIGYFDKESHLLVRFDMEVKSAMGTLPMQSYISDYQDADGILLPRKAVIKMMGMERIAVTESVKHNVEMEEDRFALPEEIQALLDKEE